MSSIKNEDIKVRQDNVTKLLTDIQVMKGKQESMDSKLIAMKQYVRGAGRGPRAGALPTDPFHHHLGFGSSSGRWLVAPCLLLVASGAQVGCEALGTGFGWYRDVLRAISELVLQQPTPGVV